MLGLMLPCSYNHRHREPCFLHNELMGFRSRDQVFMYFKSHGRLHLLSLLSMLGKESILNCFLLEFMKFDTASEEIGHHSFFLMFSDWRNSFYRWSSRGLIVMATAAVWRAAEIVTERGTILFPGGTERKWDTLDFLSGKADFHSLCSWVVTSWCFVVAWALNPVTQPAGPLFLRSSISLTFLGLFFLISHYSDQCADC